MGKIAIVYWSGTGNTEAMANFVAEGAGGQADLFTPGEFSADLISSYSALAFGCPSMGAEQLEEAEFEPMFEAVKPRLSGKTIGLFGSYGWGDGEWMRTWAEDCESAGCSRSARCGGGAYPHRGRSPCCSGGSRRRAHPGRGSTGLRAKG